MNKIKLTGKLTACNKIDACKADGEIHNATIEIDHPDFSSLKEGDEVLVRRVIQKMSWGLYVPENIAAILPKQEEQVKYKCPYCGSSDIKIVDEEAVECKTCGGRTDRYEAMEEPKEMPEVPEILNRMLVLLTQIELTLATWFLKRKQ